MTSTSNTLKLQIDASDFDSDALIEFGTAREKEKWVIIFAGWRSTKTRISERELEGDRWIDLMDKKIYAKHSKKEWESVRLLKSLKFLFEQFCFRRSIRIEILAGSIRITTNKNGTWMNAGKPLEFKSSEIRKEDVTHMYVGIDGERARGNMKVNAYKYV